MTENAAEGLLSPSDIADLAGVSRAAVSNWRKRMSDFPQPAGGSANKPLFASVDVSAWLGKHPEKAKSRPAGGTHIPAWEAELWGIANKLRGIISIEELGEVVATTAVAASTGSKPPAERTIPSEVQSELVSALKDVPQTELARVVDGLLKRTARAQGKSAGWHGFVGSRTSALLAALAAPMKSGTLYDPTCGIGIALIQALDSGARPDFIVGEDINETAVRIAEARARLRNIELITNVNDVVMLDHFTALRADVIIAEPPIGLASANGSALLDSRLNFGIPPRKNLDGFWPQHVVSHLADNGVGYLITSPGFLFRSGSEAEIRLNLLRGGWIDAVVSLPAKMLPNVSIPLALLVLRKSKRESVLFIDASECGSPETSVPLWLNDDMRLDDAPHRYVPITEILSQDNVLSPHRWLEEAATSAGEIAIAFDAASSQLYEAVSALHSSTARMSVPSFGNQHQVRTIAELLEAGALEISAARPASSYRGDDIDTYFVDAAAVRRRELPDTRNGRHRTESMMTESGDVLISTMNDVQSIVDEHGGLIPVGSLHRLRVKDRNVLDPHYLADVVAGAWNLRLAVGAAIQRIPIRDIEVPIIPIEAQRAFHAAIVEVRSAQLIAAQAAQAASDLAVSMLNAIRYDVDLPACEEGNSR